VFEAITGIAAVIVALLRHYTTWKARQGKRRENEDEQQIRRAVAERDADRVSAHIDELRRKAAREHLSAGQQRDDRA
jgi:Flp pilus assembly protein TadB